MTIADFFAGGHRNVFEPLARRLAPEVDEALSWLGRRGDARLTGTGACVFAAYERRSAAEEALRGLPAPWRGFVARGVNRSPLLDRLDREPVLTGGAPEPPPGCGAAEPGGVAKR